MTAAVIVIALAIWVLYSGFRFYKQVNWSEKPAPTPDFAALRKREAELLHIQEFLEKARAQGKLSAAAVEEYNRFCDREIAEMPSTAKLTPPSKC